MSDVTNPTDYDANDRFHELLRNVYHKKRGQAQQQSASRKPVHDIDDDDNEANDLQDVDTTGSSSKSLLRRAARSKSARGRSASSTMGKSGKSATNGDLGKRAVRSSVQRAKQTSTRTRTRPSRMLTTSTTAGTKTTSTRSSPRTLPSSPRDDGDESVDFDIMDKDDNISGGRGGGGDSSSSASDVEFSPPSIVKTRPSTRRRSRGRGQARRAATAPMTITTSSAITTTNAADRLGDIDIASSATPPIGTFSPRRTPRSRPAARQTNPYPSRNFTYPSTSTSTSTSNRQLPQPDPNANVDGPADTTVQMPTNEDDGYGSSTDEEPMIAVPKAYFKALQRETLWRREAMARMGLDGMDEDGTGNLTNEGVGIGGSGAGRSRASTLDFVRD